MGQVTTIGLDVAKKVLQVHGVDAAGATVLRRQLKRPQVERFFAALPRCVVGIEACGSGHYWARRLRALGHDARLLPPSYVKPYVRRNKHDPADAEALSEAVGRPRTRVVPVKSEAQQAAAAVHRVRDKLIGQRTQLQNMLRGQMAEFGWVVPTGPAHVKELVARLDEAESVPAPLAAALRQVAGLLAALEREIAAIETAIVARHRADPRSRRLATIPGFGPILSSAMSARAVEPERFRSGRDFAAWLGLTPKESSSGGKVRLGGISKQGDATLRRLLVSGAQAVLNGRRAKDDPWLERLLKEKPRMVAAVALANKMARIAWAVMVREEDFRRAPAAA
jgi:transposase